MIQSHTRLLTEEQLLRVHEGSLEILQDVGMIVRNEKARDLFATHGCIVEADSELVKFPPAVVEKYRALLSPTFTFRGRDPQYDVTIPRGMPAFTSGSSAPNVIDPISGEERRCLSVDIARIGQLVNELPGFDIHNILGLAADAPQDQWAIGRVYPALKNTLKPCRVTARTPAEAEEVLNIGYLIAGSKEAYMEHPFITFGGCAVISPLTLDQDSTEMLMYYAERGLAYYGTVAPIGGLSTPYTLLGMLALTNAEWLAMAILAQMVKPGTPLVYCFLPVFSDLRTGAYASGGIEVGIMQSALAQMARFHNVPSGAYLGTTNSKLSDEQAGFEKGMPTLLGALSGTDLIIFGGIVDTLMSFDYAQMMIDNEIARMIKRVVKGMEFSDENLCLDEIKEAGPAGLFIEHPNTLARMKTTCLIPDLATREDRESWQEGGRRSIRDRAMDQARDILTKPNKGALDAETDARVRNALGDDLVPGDSVPPEEWKPLEQAPERRRHNKRRKNAA
jgi:trimethylamine--corrinoid protein Co-methyltransferase